MYCFHYTTCTKPGNWAFMCIVSITLHVQSQVNERSCVLLPLHYQHKARSMNGNVYCYHYATCTKPGQWAVMRIVTIILPVQRQDNERSCVLLPLHYLYKAKKMSGHVYCYHYTTCTKPGKWAVMCIVTITLPVQSQVNERSCVLLPLHYLYKARTMSVHVYCYHYTTCTKPSKWAVMCIVTITLPLQNQENERPCMCIVTITISVQNQDNEQSCVLLPLHYLYKAR